MWNGPGRSSDDYQLGKTKVFLRNAVENALEDERQKKIVKYVILLQTYFRGYIAKIHYKRVRGASLVIQRSAWPVPRPRPGPAGGRRVTDAARGRGHVGAWGGQSCAACCRASASGAGAGRSSSSRPVRARRRWRPGREVLGVQRLTPLGPTA